MHNHQRKFEDKNFNLKPQSFDIFVRGGFAFPFMKSFRNSQTLMCTDKGVHFMPEKIEVLAKRRK